MNAQSHAAMRQGPFAACLHYALILLAALALTLGVAPAMAVDAAPVGERPALAKDKPFKITGEAKATGEGAANLRLSIWMFKADHYVYDARTSIEVKAPEGVKVGEVIKPESKTKHDPNFDEDMEVYVGTPTFVVPLSFTAADPFKVSVNFRYQGCNPTQCFFPTTETLELTVTPIKGGAAAPAATDGSKAVAGAAVSPAASSGSKPSAAGGKVKSASPPATTVAASADSKSIFETDVGDAVGQSLWLAFLVAFAAGLLTSLTPCVYPVIPITLRVLGASQADSRAQAFSLAFVYVLGMALVYTALGVVAAATGGLFGAWLQSPWVIGTLVVIFVAMGFSMLGAFDIAVPSGVANRLQNVQGRGYTGALLAGAVSGVVVGPCSAPVLLSLLGYIAESGQIALGSALMFTYAMGLGVLFLFLGTFAASMPKSGAWMDAVKGVLALMIFGVALWYMRLLVPVLLTEGVYMVIVGAFALTVGVFVGAFHPVGWEDAWNRKTRKALGLLAVAAGLFFVVDGLLATRGVDGGLAGLRASGGTVQVAEAQIDWVTSESEGLATALAEGRPAIVDFTADWCAVCQEIEHEVYGDPRVVHGLDGFVPILIDGTNDSDPQFMALKAKYDVAALPKVVFIDSEGNVLDDLSVTDLVTPDDFLRRMDVAKNAGKTALR